MEGHLIIGDSLIELAKIKPGSVDFILTSPPYNLGKEYEKSLSVHDYKSWIIENISECYRVLNPRGSICIQLGNYVKNSQVYPLDCLLFNDFVNIGLLPRNRIVWHFGHGLHCKKRFSGRHESVLWFTKTEDYHFNLDPVRVPSKYPSKKHYKGDKKGQLSGNPLGKNPSDVWEISNVKHNHPEKTDHPCQFPEELARRLVLSLTNMDDLVLDPFCGAGTSLKVAKETGRRYIGIDKEESYISIASKRLTPCNQ